AAEPFRSWISATCRADRSCSASCARHSARTMGSQATTGMPVSKPRLTSELPPNDDEARANEPNHRTDGRFSRHEQSCPTSARLWRSGSPFREPVDATRERGLPARRDPSVRRTYSSPAIAARARGVHRLVQTHRPARGPRDVPPAEWEALYAPRTETTISREMKRGTHLTRSP